MEFLLADLTKLLVSAFLGAIIGAEREIRNKAVGFRTMILICIGSTLFTIISERLGGPANPDRIAASIITGIGFLGAGAILHSSGHVLGITTAATIWIAAALGMAIGDGQFLLAGCTALVGLFVLWGLSALDDFIDSLWQSRTYEIAIRNGGEKIPEIASVIRGCGLHMKEKGIRKEGDTSVILLADIRGKAAGHKMLTDTLIGNPDVTGFRF